MLLGASLCGCEPARANSSRPPAEAHSPARRQPIPADLQQLVKDASEIGRELYVLDHVAAVGTDVMLEHVPEPARANLGGYLPFREATPQGTPSNSFLDLFFTRDTPPRVLCDIRVAPGAPPSFQSYDPPKAAPPGLEILVHARQAALAALPAGSQSINPLVVPGPAGKIAVYLLAATTVPNVAVFGRHYRALVSADGARVETMTPLSKGVLEMPLHAPNGSTLTALFVTHLVTDYPLETHVFTSLLTRLPVYVSTKRGLWLVDGDDIGYLGAVSEK